MFKKIKLSKDQEEKVLKVQNKCTEICDYMHPVEKLDFLECSEQCKERNRDLYRMANASNWGVLISLIVLGLAFFVAVKH